MIPIDSIDAWAHHAPWATQPMVEQDLIISRAMIEIFSDLFLQNELRMRGGTALSKLHFPEPIRYSEDIDLVRSTRGPIGEYIDSLRNALVPWLGKFSYTRNQFGIKLFFKVPAEVVSNHTIRIKVEVNIVETFAFDPTFLVPFSMENPWFTGAAEIATFSKEEMIATKLRALLQRNKGRDLFDIAYGLKKFDDLNLDRVIECFLFYFKNSGLSITRAEAERRMLAKLVGPTYNTEIRRLLPEIQASKLTDSNFKSNFVIVFENLIAKLPGDPWSETKNMIELLELESYISQ